MAFLLMSRVRIDPSTIDELLTELAAIAARAGAASIDSKITTDRNDAAQLTISLFTTFSLNTITSLNRNLLIGVYQSGWLHGSVAEA